MSWKRWSFLVPCVVAICGSALIRANTAESAGDGHTGQVPQRREIRRTLALEAQGWLMELIKINTTNPPGNEQQAAKYIAGILTKEGITPEILDLTPGQERGGGAFAQQRGARSFESAAAGGAHGCGGRGQEQVVCRSVCRT